MIEQGGHEPPVPDGGLGERPLAPRQPVDVDAGEPADDPRQLPEQGQPVVVAQAPE